MEEKDTKLISNKLMTIFIIIVSIVMIYTIITSFLMTGIIHDKYGPPDNMVSSIPATQLSSFNSNFMKYEGIRTGSQIKQLIEIVNKSNLEYEGTDLIVCINGNIGDDQYIFKCDIEKKYEVKIEKVDGLVNNIIINEIEEGDYNNETY